MDPLTQGTIGAMLPQALGKKNLGIIALLGFLSDGTRFRYFNSLKH